MATRRPLVVVAGDVTELPSGDTVAGASGGSAVWTEVEVDFGTTPTTSARFTITDSNVSASSKVAVLQSGNTATGRVGNDAEWDAITYAATPASGSFTLTAFASGAVAGARKVLYQVF